MRNILLSIVLVLLATGALMAQDSTPLTAYVPFDFYVGDKLMTAGDYEVRTANVVSGHIWLVNPAEPKPGAFATTYRADKPIKNENNYLVFNKYSEDRIFLHRIVHANNPVATELVKTKKEREVVVSTLRAGLPPAKVFLLAKAR